MGQPLIDAGNDTIFGTNNVIADIAKWTEVCYSWNSGSNTEVVLEIHNNRGGTGGNDLGIDDINFQSCSQFAVSANNPSINCLSPCVDVTATITSGPGNFTYSWNTGATTSTINVCPTQTTSYTVTVNGTLTCPANTVVSGTAVAVVTVGGSPVIISTTSATTCPNAPGSLIATGADTYAWSPATDLSATTGSNVTVTSSTPRTYTVTGTTAGCTGSATVEVKVNNSLTVSVSPQTTCSGVPVTLTAATTGGSGSISFDWSPATGLSSTTVANVTATLSQTETYVVNANSNGCTASTSVVVTVDNPSVSADAGADVKFCSQREDFVQLVASGGATYSWLPTEGLNNPNISNPQAAPDVTTKYVVKVQNTCNSAYDTVLVTIGCGIKVPNVITPNGDADNEYLKFTGLEDFPNSKLVIYDRWGLKMYETDNYLNNWNGINQFQTNQPVSDGVYYYILFLADKSKTVYPGFVQVLREKP